MGPNWRCACFGLCLLVALTSQMACFESAPAPKKPQLREYQEGGILELQVQGSAVGVRFDSFQLANTDEGAPDVIEIGGPGTYLAAAFNDKLHDGANGMSDYGPLKSRSIPIQPQAGAKVQTINLPGLGTYPVLSGSLTMQKYRHGMEGRDWWEGSIELTVRTAVGPSTLFGTFKGGIVPTW